MHRVKPIVWVTLTAVSIFVVSFSLSWLYFSSQKQPKQVEMPNSILLTSVITPEANAETTMVITSPSPTPQTQSVSQISPDGKISLNLKTTQVSSELITYIFSVSHSEAPEKNQTIFTRTVSPKTVYQIPFNTWSPDNKHFFVQKIDGSEQQILIFKADGSSFKQGDDFLDVTQAFSQKLPKKIFKEATGWASEILLIVNSKGTDESADGVSYWYDITSQSFIQLSSNFN